MVQIVKKIIYQQPHMYIYFQNYQNSILEKKHLKRLTLLAK